MVDGWNRGKMRRKHPPQLKAKAAIEALKGLRPVNEIAGDLEVHPGLVTQWKRVALEGLPELFAKPRKKDDSEALATRLYEEIGRLKVELDWLKKKSERLG